MFGLSTRLVVFNPHVALQLAASAQRADLPLRATASSRSTRSPHPSQASEIVRAPNVCRRAKIRADPTTAISLCRAPDCRKQILHPTTVGDAMHRPPLEPNHQSTSSCRMLPPLAIHQRSVPPSARCALRKRAHHRSQQRRIESAFDLNPHSARQPNHQRVSCWARHHRDQRQRCCRTLRFQPPAPLAQLRVAHLPLTAPRAHRPSAIAPLLDQPRPPRPCLGLTLSTYPYHRIDSDLPSKSILSPSSPH